MPSHSIVINVLQVTFSILRTQKLLNLRLRQLISYTLHNIDVAMSIATDNATRIGKQIVALVVLPFKIKVTLAVRPVKNRGQDVHIALDNGMNKARQVDAARICHMSKGGVNGIGATLHVCICAKR